MQTASITPTLSKSEIRNLYSKSRDAKLFAGEAIARAADRAADGDVDGFQTEMAEAARLALVAAKYLNAYRAAHAEQVSA